ncbi:MAG TPA: TetR/AcrR family transcriptional regulator [Capsulimonadaceae bacterium]|jgi:AcrR family transcriptional regulator
MGIEERREREKAKRRSDILEASKALFFTKGFRDTTIDDIARSTELARGTIYLYFENKEEIYATILEDGLDTLLGLIRASYASDTDPLTNLLNGHDAFLRFHDEHPQYYAVLMLERLQISDCLPAQLKERIQAKTQGMVTAISRVLQEGVDAGFFRPMPIEQVAMLQMGISMGFVQMMEKCGGPAEGIATRAEAREVLHDLIANGVMTRKRT